MDEKSDTRINFRLTEKELALVKAASSLRFIRGANGMTKDNISQYVRSLIRKDVESALKEIKERRRV